MVAPLEIRAATEADIPALAGLYRHLNPDELPCPPETAAVALRQIATWPGSAVFLGEIAGAAVSSCTLIVIPNLTRGGMPFGLIENVVTHSEQRGRGFGTRLLHAAAERAWKAGCYKVMLLTGTSKATTLAFYAAAGFQQSKTGFQMRRKGI